MIDTLLSAVRRYAETHADPAGLAQTPIPGLATVRATSPTGLVHTISRPLVCLVLQGVKQVAMGTRVFTFAAGESLLITADVPTVSQVTRASPAAPYLSLVLELDPAIIADLAVSMKSGFVAESAPVRVEPTDAEVADAALRLMRLVDRPSAVPVLHALRMHELSHWTLTHMWTAPSSQGVLQCFDQIACVHMSGLSVRSHMSAGQDGFRDKGSKQHCDLDRRPLGQPECPASWIDRSHHLLIILQVLASAQHGCSSGAPRVWPISRPRRPQRRAQVLRYSLPPLASASTRCALSCWPAPPRPASATCA